MERLTTRNNGRWQYVEEHTAHKYDEEGEYLGEEKYFTVSEGKHVDLLAEYEDTELTPEEVENMNQLDMGEREYWRHWYRELNRENFNLRQQVKKQSCEGCVNIWKYENEVEYGAPSPCTLCKRRCHDNYTT
jgi:hypothetical protein